MKVLPPLIGRRDFLASTASAAAGALLLGGPGDSSAFAAALAPDPASSGDMSIRPFRYQASDAELADLKRRVKSTKWPARETVNDASQGVNLATMQKLADYWADHHDWRTGEAKLMSYPNFLTNIDGLDIHFIHAKSKHPNALP